MDAGGAVVVVGGGVAGLSTAAELRRLGHTGPVTVVDAGRLPHDRPPLSKTWLRTGDDDDVRLYPSGWYAEQDVRLLAGTTVLAVDPGVPAVRLDDGQLLPADAVVLAQGATAHRLPVPGGGLALTLRTLADAERLRARLRPGSRLVVVGAGLVGAEVTATAVGQGVDVTLVDPDPLPLAAVVGDVVARVLHADHTAHGVPVVTDAVTGLREEDGRVTVALGGGGELPADVVLVATGMVCVDDLAREAGLDVAADGGVLVDDHQRTSAPAVLAVGDGTRRRRADGTAAAPAGHWEAARLDGAAAAAVLRGLEPPVRGASWFWSDRWGRHVEVTGEPTAGSRTVVRGTPGPGPFAVLGWHDGVLTGAVTVDDPRTARAARRLVDRGVVVDPDALTDPGTDLRALLRG